MNKILITILFSLLASPPLLAGNTEQKASDAIEVLSSLAGIPEEGIPESLLSQAEGIAVIPDVVKAGFVIGGRRGKGLLSIRDKRNTWSYPVFITITGGSIGFQAGVQSTDLVLVFRTRRSVDSVVDGTFTLGADAAVAAGPVGRKAAAATDTRLKAEIYSYSRSRGLFAGISLDGSSLKIDSSSNEEAYGESTSARKIFAGRVARRPAELVKFKNTLEEMTSGL